MTRQVRRAAHLVRSGASPVTSPVVLIPLLVLCSAAAACGPTNENPPDQLLRDSLGLQETDQVFRVTVSASDNRERPRPPEVRVPPGTFVEFVTTDRRLHTVSFLLDSIPRASADFLTSSGQDRSPPLLELGARFVVSFRDAPPGRYPYRVEGNGEPGRGVVIVEREPPAD